MSASSNNAQQSIEPQPENHKYVDITPDGEISSKTNDPLNVISLSQPDVRHRSNVASGDTISSAQDGQSDKKEHCSLKEDVGLPGEVFFRRAKSAKGKISATKTAVPRRSNSFAQPERIKLSKQTSNDSNISGASNTAFLSGC